mmetsp:Transcript_3523/g.5321  ORF Transcript_3523/g.5321 Transcript_3523/m.5321 type:complete len:80 (+) Transcript_3523:687-926(+)
MDKFFNPNASIFEIGTNPFVSSPMGLASPPSSLGFPAINITIRSDMCPQQEKCKPVLEPSSRDLKHLKIVLKYSMRLSQ